MPIRQINGVGASKGPATFVERAAAMAAATPPAAQTPKVNDVRPPVAAAPTAAPTASAVADAVKQLNKSVEQSGQSISFSIDTDSGRTVVKVIDTETQKVLRQVPSETTIAIAKTLDSVKGQLINQKA